MKIDIYKDSISYVTNDFTSIPTNESNISEEARIAYVTELAAVSRGKDRSANPPKRYKALLNEAAPTHQKLTMASPSRPLEFLPIVVDIEFTFDQQIKLWSIDKNNEIIYKFESYKTAQYLLRYSYYDGDKLYTNMRAMLNAGVPYDSIPYNTSEDLKHFKALKANIPMMIWAQVPNTHTQLSKEAQSDRVAENNDYWLPSDFRNKVFAYPQQDNYVKGTFFDALATKILQAGSRNDVITILLSIPSQNDVQAFFKILGYKREIWARAMYYFKYKEVIFTGWENDPHVWNHLFLERNAEPDIHKNWTQPETQRFVECIKELT